MLKFSLGVPKKSARKLTAPPQLIDLQQIMKQADVSVGQDFGLAWNYKDIEFKLYVRYEASKIMWRMWNSAMSEGAVPYSTEERDPRVVLRLVMGVCNEVAGVTVVRAQSLANGTPAIRVPSAKADDEAFIATLAAPLSPIEIALLKHNGTVDSASQIDSKGSRAMTATMMNATLQLARKFADQVNREEKNQNRQIVVSEIGEITDFIPTPEGNTQVEEKVFRWRASTVESCLSARGRNGRFELFLLPARDAVSVGIANKEINPIGSVSLGLFEDQLLWMHDGAAVAPLEVRSLVLKGFTALMRGSTESPEYVERELEMRNLSQRIVSQQEEVQRRIARDLHDAVIADLTLLKRAVLSEPPVSRDHVSQSLDAVVLKLREICYELSPSDLKDWGLNTTLEALVEQVAERTGANCMLNFVDNIPSLDSFVELHIFRIIQEALNNSAKYSGASQISVTAELKHGWLSFEVRDNGKGFDASQLSGPSKHGGMGRTSMQERVEMIRAVFPTRLDVTSQPGAGTTTTLFIKVRG